ncbi:MAG: hypothetical protein PCFJNLEI_02402 [Verrucomicrobiae bacterium]|nr:hypothetical protein [Verrucomicrobiae bacterium]
MKIFYRHKLRSALVLVILATVLVLNLIGYRSEVILVLCQRLIASAQIARNLDSKDNFLIHSSLDVLGRRQSKLGESKARQLLHKPGSWKVAAIYLGRLGHQTAVPYLIKALGSQHMTGLREVQANLLQDLTGQSYGVDFPRWREWWMLNHPCSTFDFESHLNVLPLQFDPLATEKLEEMSYTDLLALGNTERFQGRLDRALIILDRAVDIAPQVPDAYTLRGFVYMETSNYHKAHASFRVATDLAPSNAIYRNNLANALDKLGRGNEAAGQYDEAIRLNGGDITLLLDRGRFKLMRGDINEAIEDFTRATTIRPSYRVLRLVEAWEVSEPSLAYKLLGDAKKRQGDFSGAEAAYSKGIALSPVFPSALEERATVRELSGNLGGAEQDRKTAVEIRERERRGKGVKGVNDSSSRGSTPHS